MRYLTPGLLLISTIAAFALAFPIAGAAEETHELRLASDVWPPFTDIAGKPRIAVQIVEEALARAGVKSGTRIVDWTEVIPGMTEKKFDGSAAIWHTTQRQSFLLFSDAYLENRLVLVGPRGSDVSATRLSDLAGKRIAVVESYAYGDTVDKTTGPDYVPGANDRVNLRKVLRGDVDYMLVDDLLIRSLLEYQGDEARRHIEVGRTPLIRRTLHFAVRQDLHESASIIASFNDAIKKMLADGTYNDILQLTWIRADVDGDGRLELVPRAGNQIGKVAPESGYSIVFPGSAKDPASAPRRYFVEGQVYESWDSVPDHYKVPSDAAIHGHQGSTSGLFSFKF